MVEPKYSISRTALVIILDVHKFNIFMVIGSPGVITKLIPSTFREVVIASF